MKKIIYSLAVAAVALGLSGCKETWDENPVLIGHEGEVKADFLNNPVMQDYPIMITNDNKTGTFHLTCSQPDFGYAAVATYKVQVSLTEDFAEFQEINQAFYDCAEINPINDDVAAATQKLSGVRSEDDLPTDYMKVYMRLRAYIAQSEENTQFISNPVYFSQVASDYLAIWVSEVPYNMYLRGGLPNAVNWEAVEQYQFKTGEEENSWVINEVYIPADTQFKVADSAWGECNWGGTAGQTTDLKIGDEYELNTDPANGGPGNLRITEEFTGKVTVRLEAGNYYLLLDPKTE